MLRIKGGTVLLPSDGLQRTDLVLRDGMIDRVGAADAGMALNVSGLLVLPGIVDLHGDAFERQLQPRPGVSFPADLALRDTESQLLANGITTAFHGVTLSWEPGLRSLPAWQALLDALQANRWTCDMRVHLRWEAFNLDAEETALADIAAGRVHLLAFNDHTLSIVRKLKHPVDGAKYSARAGITMDAFRALADRVAARADDVPAAQQRVAAAARRAGLPMASHDDNSISSRNHFRTLGARICEFPITEDVAHAAAAAGDFVAMHARHQRPHFHAVAVAGADFDFSRLVREYFHQRIADGAHRDHRRNRHAAPAAATANTACRVACRSRRRLSSGR